MLKFMRWQQVRHDLATEQQQQAPQLVMGNNQAETRVGAASEEWSSPSTGSTLRCELLIKATGHSHLTRVILHQLQGGFIKFISIIPGLVISFFKVNHPSSCTFSSPSAPGEIP